LDLFELTESLLRIDSVTGNEGPVVRFLKNHLETAGLRVTLQDVADERKNLYAFIEEPRIVLSTHLDTVGPFLPFSQDAEYVYGRGACDAKGISAAMVLAVQQLIREGFRDVGLLFVVGEERGSDGARAADRIPNRCAYLVNGEPTDNKLALGSKGAVRFRLSAKGRAAHAAMPETGESAIEKLLDVLSGLRRMDLPGHPVLGKSTLTIGTIHGGTFANVVPERAEAECMIRSVEPAADLAGRIRAAIHGHVECEVLFACDPVWMEWLDGYETTVVSFATDIPLLPHWGKPILLGPGSILDAHTAGERILKSELQRSVVLYHDLTKQLLAKMD
jgi:acetylornithine deacetylase